MPLSKDFLKARSAEDEVSALAAQMRAAEAARPVEAEPAAEKPREDAAPQSDGERRSEGGVILP